MPWHLSDHLALVIEFGPDQPKAKHFPLKVLEDTVFQKQAKACTRIWKEIMKNITCPQDLCQAWDGYKQSLVDLAHKRQKEMTKEKNKVKEKYTKILLSPHVSKRKKKHIRFLYKQVCLRESIEQNAEELKRRMRTWECNSHAFHQLGNDSNTRGFSLPNKTTEEVLDEAHDFYKALFTKEAELQKSPQLLSAVRGKGSRVSDLEFDDETIIKAIDSMSKGKAPGPDTVPVELWKLLKLDIAPMLVPICNNTSSILFPPSWRKGKISLISKCKDGGQPESLNDARPITLLNTDYKIFSKALASHLGGFMSKITIPEQRAFIHGRDIRHNIILAESLLYRDPQPDGALLSLDWAKAHDRVDYRYLLDVLNSYNFPGGLVKKLLATMLGFELQITTPDGKQPFFPRERGVGQGCPCAPLLFALAIDPVARLIKNKIDGIPVSQTVDV